MSRSNAFVRRSKFVSLLTSLILVLAMLPASAWGLRILSSGDMSLTGATLVDFDSEPTDTFFSSRDFGGFTVTADASDLHIDGTWCDDFGTSGNCLDTFDSSNATNDEFEIVFTQGVSAFGFELNALDIDWTIETLDESGGTLGTYTVVSQSPGLTGFDRRGFFGATELAAIKSIRVSSASGSDRALIDDVRFVVATPEPGTGVLLGLGLALLAAGRRQDRR